MLEASEHLSGLNSSQRAAVEYGTAGLPREIPGPLLVIAGAGTGKTSTLAHRVGHLVVRGADPRRVLLLTFTRRAAETMTRRAEQIASQVASTSAQPARIGWSGTFHAIANRLLRQHAESVGLDPSFTVLDRSDSADLLNVVRNELGFSNKATRFPRKDTCLAIYSHAVNAGHAVEKTLERAFPWCANWVEELKRLFGAYVEAKQQRHLLDYDDLLLYWFHLMQEGPAESVRRRFDHVLVDEYQDTNALQAGILLGLKPDGRGLTVVGDDAQSIYSFRAATVRNILDFPRLFEPPAQVITLEQNYRSTQPILDAANAVIALASEGFAKHLFSTRRSEQQPLLVTPQDEQAQVDFVVERVLEHREGGDRPETAGGADAHGAPFRSARGRAGPAQYSVREVRRAQVPRGGAREGSALSAALGREPARRDRRIPGAAALAGTWSRPCAPHPRPVRDRALRVRDPDAARRAAGDARRSGRRSAS